MYQTKGAIGNLLNRYRAVLKKCHLLNTFGSLAVAGMLVMGGVGIAGAAKGADSSTGTETTTPQYGGAVQIKAGETKDFTDRDFTGESASIGGGAIYNQGTVKISGGTFSDNRNTTPYDKDAPNDDLAGGAIFNTGKLYVSGTTFDSNKSTLKAGAIFNRQGEVYIENSKFTGNTVPWSSGGAIVNESGDKSQGVSTIYIMSSDFTGNESGNGGAVWNGSSAVLYIGGTESDRSLFENNKARIAEGETGAEQGGAITNAGEMYIAYTDFKGNTAEGNGGAVANVQNANKPLTSSEISFSNVTFEGNTAEGNGGAIYNVTATSAEDGQENNIVLDTVDIKDNTAGTAGGGIYNAANSNIVLTGNNEIVGNTSGTGESIADDDVYTAGDVTVASGETSIGALTIADTGSVNVGGDAPATLTVSSLANNGELTVSNLGTLSAVIGVTFNEDNSTIKALTGVTGKTATVEAGGTYKVTFNDGTSELSSAQASAVAEKLLGQNPASKLYLAGVTIEGLEAKGDNGHYVYSGIKDLAYTVDAIRDAIVDVKASEGGSLDPSNRNTVSGTFQQVHLVDNGVNDSWADANKSETLGSYILNASSLTLRGSEEGGALVYYTDATEGEQAGGLRIGSGTAEEKAAVTLGDSSVSNKGSLGTVIFAGTGESGTLNVLGNNKDKASFDIEKLYVGATPETSINIAGATLNIGEMTTSGGSFGVLDLADLTDGSMNVDGSANIESANLHNGSSIVANAVQNPDTGTVTDGDITISDTTRVSGGSYITANGGDVTLGDVELDNGSIFANTGSFTVSETETIVGGDITISGTLTGSGDIEADANLKVTSGYTGGEGEVLTLQADAVTIGTLNSAAGTVNISATSLNTTSTATLDGENFTVGNWDMDGAVTAKDSTLSVGYFGEASEDTDPTSTLSQALTLTGTTLLVHGDENTLAEAKQLASFQNPEGTTLYISKTLTFNSADGAAGALVVGDMGETTSKAPLKFAGNSLTIVDGSVINGDTAAFTGAAAAYVADGAKLLITDAVADVTYTVIGGEETSVTFGDGTGYGKDATGWYDDNLLSSSDMITLKSDDGKVFNAKRERCESVKYTV